MTKRKLKKKSKKILTVCLVISILILLVLQFNNFQESKLLRIMYPVKYEEIVLRYSDEFGVDPYLVYAVMKQESNFKEKAVSSAKARGLMQITEDTFDWLKIKLGDKETTYDDLYKPEYNIKYGTYFLSILSEEFKMTSTQLAAYNAGMNITKKWLTTNEYSSNGKTLHTIPYKETEKYVKIVMNNYSTYKKIY